MPDDEQVESERQVEIPDFTPYGNLDREYNVSNHRIQLSQNSGKWYVIHAIYDGRYWNKIWIGNRYGYTTRRAALKLYHLAEEEQYRIEEYRRKQEENACHAMPTPGT